MALALSIGLLVSSYLLYFLFIAIPKIQIGTVIGFLPESTSSSISASLLGSPSSKTLSLHLGPEPQSPTSTLKSSAVLCTNSSTQLLSELVLYGLVTALSYSGIDKGHHVSSSTTRSLLRATNSQTPNASRDDFEELKTYMKEFISYVHGLAKFAIIMYFILVVILLHFLAL